MQWKTLNNPRNPDQPDTDVYKRQVDAYINGTSTQIDYTDPIKAELSTPAVNKLSVKWDESCLLYTSRCV